jgi:hypothetical protein
MNNNSILGKFSMSAIAVALFSMTFTACKKDDDTPTTKTVCEDCTTFDTSYVKGGTDILETIITIDDNGAGLGTMILTKNKTWVLEGFVFVNEGQTLTIEPGTIIKGQSGQGEKASALIVARGAKIMASGTAAEPIIFTAEADALRRKADGTGYENGGNLPFTARGLWGGVIILGKASQNTAPAEQAIEGIPTDEARGIYGGTEDTDNSGMFQYISIRHGGTDIGAGNEINGLSLGCVGNGTTIDHIEVIANKDDGVEFYGGTVNTSYIVVVAVGDDGIDYDQGYRGKNQFIAVYYEPNAGGTCGEHDGGTTPEDGAPYATPTFFNCTYFGRGTGAGKNTIVFRDNAGGNYQNSIMMNQDKGATIEDLASGEDSKARLDAGDLQYKNNIHWNVAGNDSAKQITYAKNATGDASSHANISNIMIVDPMMTSGTLIPTVNATGATGLTGDNFIKEVSYYGAFDPASSTHWFEGWTLIGEGGVIAK